MQGKLFLCFWLSISHTRVRDNPHLRDFLAELKQIDRDQEVKCSYKSTLSASDLILRSGENLASLVLEQAVLTLKWSLTVPIWHLIGDFVGKVGDWLSALCVFSDVDMAFDSAHGSTAFPASWQAARLLEQLVTEVRQPLESSPSLMKPLQTSLAFYESRVKVVGRIASLGIEVSVELPNLSELLHHRKAHSFL